MIDDLGYRKMSARSISYRWTETTSSVGMPSAVAPLPSQLLHYMSESKQPTMELRKEGQAASVKAKTWFSAGKVIIIAFWDFRDVLHIDFLRECRAINSAYYCDNLDKVKLLYQQKRIGFPIRDVIVLHDNAKPHIGLQTREEVWTVTEYPPSGLVAMFNLWRGKFWRHRFDNEKKNCEGCVGLTGYSTFFS